MPQSDRWQILYIEDDEEDYFLTREMLSRPDEQKVDIEWAGTYEEGRSKLLSGSYDAVLVDYNLGAATGIEIIREFHARYPAPFILYTSHGSHAIDQEAQQGGATMYLTKSDANPLLLERTIRYAIERKQAEEALRDSEERHAFLLRLSDVLRPLSDPVEIQSQATRFIGQYLRCNRVSYADVEGNDVIIHREYAVDVPPMLGRFRLEDFGPEIIAACRRGETIVIDDVRESPMLDEAALTSYDRLSIRALIGTVLIKGGDWVAAMSAYSNEPRQWTRQEVALVEEAAERTWAAVERARAEETLRVSEARYRALYEAMDEGFILSEVIFDEHDRPVDIYYHEVNPAAIRMLGMDFTGKRLTEIDPNFEPYWFEIWGRVARTGVGERQERYAAPLNTWFNFYIFRIGGPGSRLVASVSADITGRKLQEAYAAFLAEVTADFSRLSMPYEIIQATGARVARFLNVTTVHFWGIEDQPGAITIRSLWNEPNDPFVPGPVRLAEASGDEWECASRAGKTFVVEDAPNDPRVRAELYRSGKLRGMLCVPYRQEGAWKYTFAVSDAQPRQWRDHEITMMEELANRLFQRLERAWAEEALRRNEERISRAFSIDTVGVMFFNLDGLITGGNEAFVRMSSYSREEMEQGLIRWDELTPSEYMPATVHAMEELRTRGECTPYIKQYIRRDGSRWWGLFAAKRLDENECVEFVQDVTERKHTEEALRESEERFRALVEPFAQAVWETDPVGWTVHESESWRAYTGQTLEERQGEGWANAIHPDDRDYALQVWRDAARDAVPLNAEFRLKSPDGSWRWTNVHATPLRGPDGRVVKWVGMNIDITEHKRAEEAMRESEHRFRTMADGTPLIIWVTDESGQMEFVNRAYVDFFGITIDEVQKSGWQPLVHPQDQAGYVDVYMQCLQTHTPFRARGRVRNHSGEWRWIESYGLPRFSDTGDFLGMAGSSMDITDRVRSEQILQRYSEELERSNQALQDFAFIASHDMHEPLRKIQAFGQLLDTQFSHQLGPEGKGYLGRITSAAARMGEMLNGLLAYSRVTSQGEAFLEIDLRQVAAEVLSDLELRIQETHARIELGELPVLRADPLQMRQMLQNLISNALKYHRPGVPPVIRVTSRALDNGQIQLIVQDNGIGFDMKDARRIFQPFVRLQGGSEFPGSGMGLAICQKIAERHHGFIRAESAPGRGSTFQVTLPHNRR